MEGERGQVCASVARHVKAVALEEGRGKKGVAVRGVEGVLMGDASLISRSC